MVNLNTYGSILVCVTQQKACERLIRTAAELKKEDGSLYVIHVTKDDWNFVDNAKDGEALEYLFSLSKSYGAELTILHSNKIPETIAQFAQHYEVELIVTGEGPDGTQNPFNLRLRSLLKDTGTRVLSVPSPCRPS
jgi:K+-sensing histidine kinase KdpD